MRRFTSCLIPAAAFIAVLAASPDSHAQDAAYDSVIGQLNAVSEDARAQGYRSVKTLWVEKVQKGRVARFTSQFEKGMGCMIASRCDTDCNTLNLSLKNAADQELAADTEGRVRPEITFVAQTTGDYTVEMTVPRCTARVCTAGIGVFCSAK